MANFNNFPQTTIRQDPWMHATMMGEVVHCGYQNTATSAPSLYIENSGSDPITLALSFWGSVAYEASIYTNCSFTGSSQQDQHLVNRYAHTVHGIATSNYVTAPLIPYSGASSFTGTQSMIWSGAAGERITPFGPNGFTGVFFVLDGTEKLRFALDRTDGASDSQEWNIDLTWTLWDFQKLTLGVLG